MAAFSERGGDGWKSEGFRKTAHNYDSINTCAYKAPRSPVDSIILPRKMRSPTIFLLLLASFVGLSTSTIYWKNHVKTVQSQAGLILFAYRHKDAPLFYSLVPSSKGKS